MHLKEAFWRSLDTIAQLFGGPWLCIGDFNCLVSNWEKKGFLPLAPPSINPLKNLINSHGLIDLGFIGSPYTWSNK